MTREQLKESMGDLRSSVKRAQAKLEAKSTKKSKPKADKASKPAESVREKIARALSKEEK
jgi:hypothetical protein